MFNHGKKSLYICAVLVSILLFIAIEFGITMYTDKSNNTKDSSQKYVINVNTISETEPIIEKPQIDENIWELEIPAHAITGPIKEGTESDVLEEYIGHFEETPKVHGNVCLASHNRGSTSGNYFETLEILDVGELLIYRVNGMERLYKVILNITIDEINLSYIQNTNDDRLTLITCVRDKPNLRRCVQAVLLEY